jgi:flagellar hook-associated protein 3 FlgL
LEEIQGVTNEEVSAQILALRTRMQASMQTTAMLFQTSLVNIIG